MWNVAKWFAQWGNLHKELVPPLTTQISSPFLFRLRSTQCDLDTKVHEQHPAPWNCVQHFPRERERERERESETTLVCMLTFVHVNHDYWALATSWTKKCHFAGRFLAIYGGWSVKNDATATGEKVSALNFGECLHPWDPHSRHENPKFNVAHFTHGIAQLSMWVEKLVDGHASPVRVPFVYGRWRKGGGLCFHTKLRWQDKSSHFQSRKHTKLKWACEFCEFSENKCHAEVTRIHPAFCSFNSAPAGPAQRILNSSGWDNNLLQFGSGDIPNGWNAAS